jgi:hypothetical protein
MKPTLPSAPGMLNVRAAAWLVGAGSGCILRSVLPELNRPTRADRQLCIPASLKNVIKIIEILTKNTHLSYQELYSFGSLIFYGNNWIFASLSGKNQLVFSTFVPLPISFWTNTPQAGRKRRF